MLAELAGISLITASVVSWRKYDDARTIQRIFAQKGLCTTDKNGKPVPWHLISCQRAGNGSQIVFHIPDGFTLGDIIENASGAIFEAFDGITTMVRDGRQLVIEIQESRPPVIHDFASTSPPLPFFHAKHEGSGGEVKEHQKGGRTS